MENIPRNTPLILVSNHEKLADPLYILYPVLRKLNKKVHFLSTGSWWFLGDTICRKWVGCIPLFDSKKAYNETKDLLIHGEIIWIFPEGRLGAGTRSPRTGAVRLAIETNTPILPIGIKSSYIPFCSVINIGKPVYLNKSISKNAEECAIDLMKHVYELRNGVG